MNKNTFRAHRLAKDVTIFVEGNTGRLPGIEHLLILIVCGHGKNRSWRLTIPSNWDQETALRQLAEAADSIDQWGSQTFPNTEVVSIVARALAQRLLTLASNKPTPDPGLLHTAFMVMHPEGAAKLAYLNGKVGREMREELLSLLKDQYA